MITCELCDRASESQSPLGWSAQLGPDRTRWTCDRCTRDNVRAIEAKLDEAWW
jgi:hypothetical protein